jgi:hypothetical protein
MVQMHDMSLSAVGTGFGLSLGIGTAAGMCSVAW